MIQHKIIIIMFIAFIVFLTTVGIKNAINKEDSKGKSPINKYLFILAKFTYFLPWIIVVFVTTKPNFFEANFSVSATWTGISLLIIGYVILWISYFQLGKHTRFGLPNGESKLITSGIYKKCRHPMYVGLFLMIIGVTFYFPNWIVIGCCVVTITIHHLIIYAEEKYMENVFGKDWEDYKMSSRRYLIW